MATKEEEQQETVTLAEVLLKLRQSFAGSVRVTFRIDFDGHFQIELVSQCADEIGPHQKIHDSGLFQISEHGGLG